MPVRFIPISVAEVPPAVAALGDAAIVAKLNLVLVEHGYRVQGLEPGQFLAETPMRRMARAVREDFAIPPRSTKHNHHALGKSPRQRARAQKRVDRLMKKGTRR